jgi:hypothetical protein
MFAVVPRSDRMRSAVEDTIRKLYRQRYDAELSTFAPTIVAELGQTGSVQCAAGIRFGHDALFCEHYLDLTIERVLERHLAYPVDRNRVVEVCHLAAPRPGHSLQFLRKLIALLRAMDNEWAIFTATRPLRSLLQRSGLAMIELARADQARVPCPNAWGNYFEHDPRIMAVHHQFASEPRGYRTALAPKTLTVDARIL